MLPAVPGLAGSRSDALYRVHGGHCITLGPA
jgi:hypothetical protein